MKKKYFVLSDVHGFYREMMKALEDAGFDINNPDHIFVHCGDIIDRGPDSEKCVDFANDLPDDRKILIRGNHEDLLETLIRSGNIHNYDFTNGTVGTARAFYGSPFIQDPYALNSLRRDERLSKYMRSLVNFAETDRYIFVHGWIACDTNDYYGKATSYEYLDGWRNASADKWEQSRWINGFRAWNAGVKEPGKTIVCGHWHVSYGHSVLHHRGLEFVNEYEPESETNFADYSPFTDDGIIGLDACTVVSRKVNCVVLED